MDAAGKDGAIRHVMSGVNPQGCQVFSFKQPSAEEVLIVWVHPELLSKQRLPEELPDAKTIWLDRDRSILDLETHLHRNGTRIIKFFLHLSKGEQAERFRDRIDEPENNWKFSIADVTERKSWPLYMQAFEDALGATSTEDSPWYVVPADNKKNARLISSQIIMDAFKDLNMSYPKTTAKRRRELESIREKL